jgi:phospholipid/cholesterol/gamma-HCH transport system substrate-binding protein
MPRPLQWRSLSGGLVSLAVVIIVPLLVLIYARVGRLHGAVINVYVLARDAQGVVRGSEVWLAGQKVGIVKDISFQPSSAPIASRLLFHTHVLASDAKLIRLDSHAEIRSGGTVIGAPVVYLSSGTLAGRQIANGDTLRIDPHTDMLQSLSTVSSATAQLPAIKANLSAALHDARDAGTRLVALADDGGPATNVMRAATQLRSRLSSSRGTAAQLLEHQEALFNRVAHAMAAADSIRTLLASHASALGRFRRDTSLTIAVGRVRDDLADVSRLAANPAGTSGRARADSAVVAALDSTRAQMASLFADMKAHPFRYLYVF